MLKFGEQVSFWEPVLNFEKSYMDFQYFGLSLPKTVKCGPKSMEKRANFERILADCIE